MPLPSPAVRPAEEGTVGVRGARAAVAEGAPAAALASRSLAHLYVASLDCERVLEGRVCVAERLRRRDRADAHESRDVGRAALALVAVVDHVPPTAKTDESRIARALDRPANPRLVADDGHAPDRAVRVRGRAVVDLPVDELAAGGVARADDPGAERELFELEGLEPEHVVRA